MSLEQQVTALVGACNDLTASVNGKIAQIDQRVENITSAISEVITSKNLINYYVDVENGDDSNSGSSSNPFKTIDRALKLCTTGSKANIYLKRSQRHVLGYHGAWSVSCYAAFVNILPWELNKDTSKSYHYDETTPVLALESALFVYGTLVFGSYQESIIIETNENTPAERIQFWTSSNVIISRSRLILNFNDESKHIPLLGSLYNYLTPIKVSLRQAEIVQTNGFLSRSGCIFSVDGATGFYYTDDVIKNATSDNTLSNVPFTP